MKLHIGPLQVPVIEKDMTKEETWGEFQCLPHPQIAINKDLPRNIQALTILHEVLECITEIYGLKLSEGDIRTLEMSLADVVKKNAKEFQTWAEDLTSSGHTESGSKFKSVSGGSLGVLGSSMEP